MLEQEERKRLRADGAGVRDGAPRGTVITVFGAKGGIGKTTISTNLATTLAKMTGANVCLLDMDTRFGDVAIMMDVAVEASIADVARNIDEIDRDKIRDYLVKHHSGVSILPAPLHPTEWRNMTPQHIEKIVELLAQTHDYVVIDTPGTFNELIAATLELANLILLVTSMDIASIKDTALALEMLRAAPVSRRQGQADDQPLDGGEQPPRGGRVAGAGVRRVLADPARPERLQQHAARAADCHREAVRARVAVDHRPGARADRARGRRSAGSSTGSWAVRPDSRLERDDR